MKIKPDDYETLLAAVRRVLADRPTAAGTYQTLNLSFTRFAWDVFRMTRIKLGDGAGAPGDLNLYAYMNDDHITTALKVAVKACGIRPWDDKPVPKEAA